MPDWLAGRVVSSLLLPLAPVGIKGRASAFLSEAAGGHLPPPDNAPDPFGPDLQMRPVFYAGRMVQPPGRGMDPVPLQALLSPGA